MDSAHDVHDVAVAFDGAVGIDVHTAGARHSTQVVAREIHEHDVLRILLRIGTQLDLASEIDPGVIRARPCSGDRP